MNAEQFEHIHARADAANDFPGAVTIEQSQADVPALLALVREQQAQIERVRAIEQRLATSKYCEDNEIAEDIRAALTATEEA